MSIAIRKLWREQEGKFFCISTRVPNVDNTWKDHFFSKDQFMEIPKWLEEHSHLDIYFCPHGFNRRSRTNEEAVAPKLLWADLDEVNPELIPQRLKPTMAFKSSEGRFVGLWVITDKAMTLELNRRINFHLCPESHSSWILTKALRMPGTMNRKYTPPQKVVTLWTDGPKYTFAKLDKLLPNFDEGEVNGNSAREIFNRYRKFIPSAVQRDMFGTAAIPGKRSQMMWKIIMLFVEAGASEEEVYEIVRVSRWNKFAGMRNEELRIRKQIAKAFGTKLADGPQNIRKKHREAQEWNEDDDLPFEFHIRSLAEVEERDIEWLWPGKIPIGELTILEGDPGVGKSFLAHWLAAQICDGKRLPTEYPSGVKPLKGNVAYFDYENDPETTVKRRVRAAGCNNIEKFFQIEDHFVMGQPRFEPSLEELMKRIDPVLVVFDTLNNYLGKGDINNSKDATQALSPFHKFARKYKCAVVVLRHLNKGGGDGPAIYRGQGNIAQTGVARVVLSCAKLNDTTEEYEGEGWVGMGTTKNNLASLGKTIVYRIKFDPTAPKGYDENAHVVMHGFIDKTSDELLTFKREDRKKDKGMTEREALDRAASFLLGLLNDGSSKTRESIMEQAEKAGISQKDVYKACLELPIVKNKGKWSLQTK
jgi:hypothetical protein